MIKVSNGKWIRHLSRKSFKAAKTRNIIAVFAIALTTLLFTLWFLLIGCAFGLCLGCPGRGREAEKYKGGMLFILLAVLELVWYPCFFVRAEVFLSVLLSILCVALCVGVFLCFRRVSRLCAGVMLIHAIWLFYLTIVCFIALFRM